MGEYLASEITAKQFTAAFRRSGEAHHLDQAPVCRRDRLFASSRLSYTKQPFLKQLTITAPSSVQTNMIATAVKVVPNQRAKCRNGLEERDSPVAFRVTSVDLVSNRMQS